MRFFIKMYLPFKLIDTFQQTMLCLLPLFHIYSMNVTMSPALRTGAKLLMLPKFEPNSFIKAIEDHKVKSIKILPSGEFFYKLMEKSVIYIFLNF